MTKPTIFFSHSSKDADMIFTIQNRFNSITGGVLDIFQSSDGQSIPFGRNWLHKIEEGLKQATIMFVFVTPNSIASNWIYFEAGFVYSKNIEVIPVGIGIDIALLKPPLNLLQGFNITSSDSMNNFISIINKKLEYQFEDKFVEQDFLDIKILQSLGSIYFDLKNIFSSMTSELFSEYPDRKGGKIKYNIEEFFSKTNNYLTTNNITYSYNDIKSSKTILVYGIKMVYNIGKEQDDKGSIRQQDLDHMKFTISPYNFEKSFTLFVDLMRLQSSKNWAYLRFELNEDYVFLTTQENLAAILSMHPEEYGFSEGSIGTFTYRDLNIYFSIYNENEWDVRAKKRYVLGISFKPDMVTYDNIVMLLISLQKKEIIKPIDIGAI